MYSIRHQFTFILEPAEKENIDEAFSVLYVKRCFEQNMKGKNEYVNSFFLG